MKHFALIELGNEEAPMIGVIQNIPNNTPGKESFAERFETAVESHFDADFSMGELPDLFSGSPYEDVTIKIFDSVFTVRIIETWFY